jgi:hypothetical protein
MNKLEEKHKKISDAEYDGRLDVKDADKAHATITKEIAIGFKVWLDGQSMQTKQYEDSELFQMYLETLDKG